MNDSQGDIKTYIENIKNLMGTKNELVIRNIIIGQKNSLEAAIIYMNGLVDKNMIDRDILNPLLLHIQEDLTDISSISDYVYKKYIAVSNTSIETNLNKVVDNIKRGKTILLIEGSCNFIVVDTTGGNYRSISEPINELSLRGPREGFIENLETNISILRRRLKDKNLVTEKFTIGKRSQSGLVIMYIDDIVDKELLKKLRRKLNSIDIDSATGNSFIEQCIEEHPYSILPQTIGSERPDRIQANLLEGRIAFLLEGTPYVITYPTVFFEFFQTEEDYYTRTALASYMRLVRYLAAFVVITFGPIYITLIKFNSELLPIQYITTLIQARKGIALTPFMSLVAMIITIEFLREGGLRLPSKIGQTLSIVGGIIIGDAAIEAKIVSSSTLFIAGIATVASFVISNYQMSLSIRLITYPMLILSNWLGVLGVVIGWFFILAYLCSLENLGVPYFSFRKDDLKDTLVREPIWKMDKRPQTIPHNDPIRESDFRVKENE